MELAGGGAFFRVRGLERLFRDIQGARYHPLQEKPQKLFAGRLAPGLDINVDLFQLAVFTCRQGLDRISGRKFAPLDHPLSGISNLA